MINTISDLMGDMITRKEALERIGKSPDAEALFNTFSKNTQQSILSFICGEQSLPMTYDPFFDFCIGGPDNRHITEIFLSDMIGEKLRITNSLPNVHNVADRTEYYSMKYIVEFYDKKRADVEFQKISILPSTNMIECIIADNILKQYNRLKQIKGTHFQFEAMWPSYLVILTEKSLRKSSYVQASIPGIYYIESEYNFFKSDVNKEGLSHVCLISLEDYIRNKSKKVSNLDAWMTFISSTDARDCMQLASIFSHFEEIYKKVSTLREDTSTLINLYNIGQLMRDHNSLVHAADHTIKENMGLKQHLLDIKSSLQNKVPRKYRK